MKKSTYTTCPNCSGIKHNCPLCLNERVIPLEVASGFIEACRACNATFQELRDMIAGDIRSRFED